MLYAWKVESCTVVRSDTESERRAVDSRIQSTNIIGRESSGEAVHKPRFSTCLRLVPGSEAGGPRFVTLNLDTVWVTGCSSAAGGRRGGSCRGAGGRGATSRGGGWRSSTNGQTATGIKGVGTGGGAEIGGDAAAGGGRQKASLVFLILSR